MNKRQTLAKRCAKLEKENAKLKKLVLAIQTVHAAIQVATQFSKAMCDIQDAIVAAQPKPKFEVGGDIFAVDNKVFTVSLASNTDNFKQVKDNGGGWEFIRRDKSFTGYHNCPNMPTDEEVVVAIIDQAEKLGFTPNSTQITIEETNEAIKILES